MKKAYFIPEETIRKTLPIRWETFLKKLRKRSFAKGIPVIFQLPKKISKDDWITIVNIRKIHDVFKDKIKSIQMSDQKDLKLIRIKPDTKFLPFSFRQKLLLTAAFLFFVLSAITGYYFLSLLSGILGLIPVLNNALIYSNFNWSKTMDIKIEPSPINKDDFSLIDPFNMWNFYLYFDD